MSQTFNIHPQFESLRSEILRLPNIFEQEGREIYHLRNVIKVFTLPDGSQINVKRYHVPAWPNRLIYSLGLRTPKGLRAFRYPEILLKHGVPTPAPIAYIEERQMGLLLYSYFVCQQCPYPHTLYEMAEASPELYEPMAEALAKFAAHMHEEGILHADFTPGNILWQQSEDGHFDFSIVDINRMRFGTVTIQQGISNLTRFWGPKRFTSLLVRAYARQRGSDEATAERQALAERARFWHRYLRKHEVPFNVEL